MFEAANVLLIAVRRGSVLKRWAASWPNALCKKAKVALACKMAVILHTIWTDGSELQPELFAA